MIFLSHIPNPQGFLFWPPGNRHPHRTTEVHVDRRPATRDDATGDSPVLNALDQLELSVELALVVETDSVKRAIRGEGC